MRSYQFNGKKKHLGMALSFDLPSFCSESRKMYALRLLGFLGFFLEGKGVGSCSAREGANDLAGGLGIGGN